MMAVDDGEEKKRDEDGEYMYGAAAGAVAMADTSIRKARLPHSISTPGHGRSGPFARLGGEAIREVV